MPSRVVEWPDYLPGYPLMMAKFAGTRGEFKAPPTHVVVHSGSLAAGVAEYFRRPWDPIKRRWRPYWTHLAWSKRLNGYVHCDSLRQTTSHVGEWWNDNSIGFELPGPWRQNPRPESQRIATRLLLRDLKACIPSLQIITGHMWITPAKKDPGPGVTDEWLSDWRDLGYEVRWRVLPYSSI